MTDLMRILYVCCEDQYLTKDNVSDTLRKFSSRFPNSMHQCVFHLILHTVTDAKRFGCARNSWCFLSENFYGVLGRHCKSKREQAQNIMITQGQRLLVGGSTCKELLTSCLRIGLKQEHYDNVFRVSMRGNGEAGLRGTGNRLNRTERFKMYEQILNCGFNCDPPKNVWSFTSAASHGRTWRVKQSGGDDEGGVSCSLTVVQRNRWGAGRRGNVLVEKDEGRRELSIMVGRIYGLYCIQLAHKEETEAVLLKVYKATRPMEDILQPYKVRERRSHYAFLPISALHLSPSIASCPDSGSLMVYGIH